MKQPQTAILILAAGASSRMGGADKLMMEADGTPLLARVIRRAKACNTPVFVTLPSPDHPRGELVQQANVTGIFVSDWADGMAASIRGGVSALPKEITSVMILPGDMPDLTRADLTTLLQEHDNSPDHITRATSDTGTPGHPVIFPADLFSDLRAITGDNGARDVIKAHKHRLRLVPLPGDHALTDLDTPQNWAKWRSAQTKQKAGW